MFWSIPISDTETLTNTPIGVKSITHIYFEDRNGGIFNYDTDGLQTLSVSIDGKQILQDVPVLPFCVSTPYAANRFKWQDVALEVNLNVSLSEVKISGARKAGDFDVVFVTSNDECNALKGFDYVEFQQFNIRNTNAADSYAEAEKILKAARANAQSWLNAKVVNAKRADWENIANAHAQAVNDYVNGENGLKATYELTDSYTVNLTPDDSDEVNANTALASSAYNAALNAYKAKKADYDTALKEYEKAKAAYEANAPKRGEPATFAYSDDDTAATRPNQAKEYIDNLVATYGLTGNYEIRDYPETDTTPAEGENTDSTDKTEEETRAEVDNANSEVAQTAYADAMAVYQAAIAEQEPTAPSFSLNSPAKFSFIYNNENLTNTFPANYTDWEKKGSTTGLKAPDDDSGTVWTVDLMTYTDNSGVHTQTMKYDYSQDERCEFAITETGLYSLGELSTTYSYAWAWIYARPLMYTNSNYNIRIWGITSGAAKLISSIKKLALLADFGKEYTISLQKAPQRVFALSIASGDSGEEDGSEWLRFCDVAMNFSLSSDVAQVFPQNTDLSLIQVAEGVPYAQAAYDFEDGTMTKNVRFRYDITRPGTTTSANASVNMYDSKYSKTFGARLYNINSWDIFLMFIYKKIA